MWTTDDLVAAVRLRAQLPDQPTADGALSDLNILTLADEELSLRLVPLVRSVRGDFWTNDHIVPVLQGVAAYRVPERAQTSGLRDVTVIDSGGVVYPIPQISVEDAWRWALPGGGSVGSLKSAAFYMQGSDLVIVPTPSYDGWSINMRYHRAASKLVPNSQTAERAVWEGAPNELRLYEYPLAWETDPYGFFADIYWALPPFGMQAMQVTVESVSALGVATLTESIESLGITLTNGPFGMAFASETSVVDLPRECWPLLVSAVAARVMDVIGDREGAKLEYALYQQEAGNVTLLLTPRIEGNPIKIVDRGSLLRSQRRGWGW